MAKKKNDMNFPVFSIHGNHFQEEIEQAVTLRLAMDELAVLIEESGKILHQSGAKLNLFLNNSLKRSEPFDYTKNFVIFSGDCEVSIYEHKVMDEILLAADEEGHYLEEEELFASLPETDDKHNLTKKQMAKCMELVDEYNEIFDTYECSIFELEDCNQYYHCIIEETKEHLSGIKLFDLKNVTNENELEPFDSEKHDLLIAKDKDNQKWKLIYLRKEDRDKFVSVVKSHTEK